MSRLPRPSRRTILTAGLLLLAGAAVNVAVAWGIAALPRATPSQGSGGWVPYDHPKFPQPDALAGFVAQDGSPLEFRAEWVAARGLGYERRAWSTHWAHSGFTYFDVRRELGLDLGRARELTENSFQRSWGLLFRGNFYAAGPDGVEEATGWPALALTGALTRPPVASGGQRRLEVFAIEMRRLPAPNRFLPTRPVPAGFALNTVFYAAILALPLSVFPIRRRLRTRRGRCPKCGYELAGLAGAETGAEGAAPCPECGAAR